MIYGHRIVEALLEAELVRAEEPSDEVYAHLSAAVGLRVVGRRALLSELTEVVALHLRQLQESVHQSLQRRPTVSFECHSRVA